MSKKNKLNDQDGEDMWFEIDDTEHFRMMEEVKVKGLKLDPEQKKRVDEIAKRVFKEFGL